MEEQHEQQPREGWTIAIKAVGKDIPEQDFSVQVHPEDQLSSLHDQIEARTGLSSSQQRLIYRGRMIGPATPSRSSPNHQQESLIPSEEADPLSRKIGDIHGLCDGQTIHLVQKRETQNEENPSSSPDAVNTTTTPLSDTSPVGLGSTLRNNNRGGGGASPSSGSLLSALLGLGDQGRSSSNSNAASVTPEREGQSSSSRSRSSATSSGRRRPHYRLSRDDLQLPDPGSLEPVRQGLMTLHTLLPHARDQVTSQDYHPLEANRTWYVGQWIDCRDTVNQWLEATIVEIVKPEDILPSVQSRRPSTAHSSSSNNDRKFRPPADDPAVSAGDLEGRRRLLLEACEEGHPEEEEGELSGYRQRDYNDGVTLLLVHYNGWPARWDEWIRSDSERIRPFRTRTRHSTAVSTYVSTCRISTLRLFSFVYSLSLEMNVCSLELVVD